jgi:tetratricopeptide (TPR) repeat protein
MERLAAEHSNVRTAIEWCLGNGLDKGVVHALQLLCRLAAYWGNGGHFAEARTFLEKALADNDELPDEVHAEALKLLGTMAYQQGEFELGTRCHEKALDLYRAAGESGRLGVVESLGNLALNLLARGDLQAAAPLAEESLALARELGAEAAMIPALNAVADVALARLEYDRAADLYAEWLSGARRLGNLNGIAYALINLGDVAYCQGDHATAQAHYGEALAASRQLGLRRVIAYALRRLARLAARAGHNAPAISLALETLQTAHEIGDKAAIACGLECVAGVLAERDPAAASRLLGAADSLRHSIESPVPPFDQAEYDADLQAVRGGLDAAAFEAHWQAGRHLETDDAVRAALAALSQRAASGSQRA